MTEIYMTKLRLNLSNREVRRLLDYRNCQNPHKFVMQGFPNVDGEKTEVRKKFGILHRLETDSQQRTITLLVQSAFKPVWNFASDELLDFSQKEIGQIYSLLPNETELMFRLRANPTKRVGKNFEYPKAEKREEFDLKFKDKEIRRRVAVYSEKEQIEWLRNKGEQHGFRLTSVQVNSDVANVSTIPNGKIFGEHEKGKLTFNAVVFDGNLQITDAEKFKNALIDGIGQGKAYGFGLLSIAKSLSF